MLKKQTIKKAVSVSLVVLQLTSLISMPNNIVIARTDDDKVVNKIETSDPKEKSDSKKDSSKKDDKSKDTEKSSGTTEEKSVVDQIKEYEENFKWDDGNKSLAIETWELNDWAHFQDKLILDGFIPESAYAKVSEPVRALKPTVENVIRNSTPYGVSNGAPGVESAELILAMIQVLKDETMPDLEEEENSATSKANFDEWSKSFGKYVGQTPSNGWSLESSIKAVYMAFTASGYAFCLSTNKNFPSIFEVKNGFKSVVEGTVMHYAYSPSEGTDGIKKFYPGIYKTTYDDNKAETFYELYQSEIDSFYNTASGSSESESEDEGDDKYIPSPSFADDVVSIYKASPAFGTLGTKSKKEVLDYLFPEGVPSSDSGMRKYMTSVTVPIWDGSKQTTMQLTVHKKLVEVWKQVFTELTNMKFPIEAGSTYCYSYRSKTSSSNLSSHAYGSTIDINPSQNPYISSSKQVGSAYKPGVDPKSVTPAVVSIFKKYGFKWGGDWKNTKDYMHFTLTGD